MKSTILSVRDSSLFNMNTSKKNKSTKEERDKIKRAEIIKAARHCVAKKGFHAASMNEIANNAKMSVGHIYRYFKNKEDIILAIVDDFTQEQLKWTMDTAVSNDIAGNHLERFSSIIYNDQESRSILLEINAEAARNPIIATMLQDSDKLLRESAVAAVKGYYPSLSEAELYARVELMARIYESDLVRRIKSPVANENRLNEIISEVIGTIWRLDIN